MRPSAASRRRYTSSVTLGLFGSDIDFACWFDYASTLSSAETVKLPYLIISLISSDLVINVALNTFAICFLFNLAHIPLMLKEVIPKCLLLSRCPSYGCTHPPRCDIVLTSPCAFLLLGEWNSWLLQVVLILLLSPCVSSPLRATSLPLFALC